MGKTFKRTFEKNAKEKKSKKEASQRLAAQTNSIQQRKLKEYWETIEKELTEYDETSFLTLKDLIDESVTEFSKENKEMLKKEVTKILGIPMSEVTDDFIKWFIEESTDIIAVYDHNNRITSLEKH